MPTYEYACKSCGEHLEVVQSFKDDALTECPNCRGSLKKVFGNIGIVFKGSGFYKNDSRPGRSGLKPAAAGSSSGSEGTSCACPFDVGVVERASLESRSGFLNDLV
jgi:putative FmdB family regulatory protein